MKSFFENMEPWRKPEGSLHLYVLPNEEETDLLTKAQDALTGIDELPLMPAAYLHCTVQRLAQFDEDITQVQYTSLGEAMGEMCERLPPFELALGAPQADGTAVVCCGSRSDDWDRLVQECRRTVAAAWGGEAPASPPAPHVTLAYARGDVDSGDVVTRLAQSEPLGTLYVGALHLVSVTARPECGTFDFTELANWDLGS